MYSLSRWNTLDFLTEEKEARDLDEVILIPSSRVLGFKSSFEPCIYTIALKMLSFLNFLSYRA